MRNQNGYGTVVNLYGNRRKPWAIRVTAGWNDGKQKYKYVSYHEKRREAVMALAEYNMNPFDLDNKNITYAEVYEAWSEKAFETGSPQKKAIYEMAYRATEVLHNMKFVDIKHRHLQGVVDASTMQPSSVGKIKTLYNQLYKEAIKMEVVKESIAHLVEVPTIEASDKEPFSEKEIATLWKGNHRFHLMLIYTGMRISELLGVKREDVHLENRYLVGGNKTQAGKKRLIPICKKVMPLFESQMSETDGGKWLFPAVEKPSVSLSYTHANNKIWKPVVEKYGMKHTAHDCRMTFISRLDTLGAPMTVTQRIVGHSTGSVTDKHYIRKSMDELLSWVDKLE